MKAHPESTARTEDALSFTAIANATGTVSACGFAEGCEVGDHGCRRRGGRKMSLVVGFHPRVISMQPGYIILINPLIQ